MFKLCHAHSGPHPLQGHTHLRLCPPEPHPHPNLATPSPDHPSNLAPPTPESNPGQTTPTLTPPSSGYTQTWPHPAQVTLPPNWPHPSQSHTQLWPHPELTTPSFDHAHTGPTHFWPHPPWQRASGGHWGHGRSSPSPWGAPAPPTCTRHPGCCYLALGAGLISGHTPCGQSHAHLGHTHPGLSWGHVSDCFGEF